MCLIIINPKDPLHRLHSVGSVVMNQDWDPGGGAAGTRPPGQQAVPWEGREREELERPELNMGREEGTAWVWENKACKFYNHCFSVIVSLSPKVSL